MLASRLLRFRGMSEHIAAVEPDERSAERERMNVADAERVVSVVAGAGLLAIAAVKRERPAAALAVASAGAWLLARGGSGRCAVYRAAHIDTRSEDTRVVLSGPGGMHVTESVLIYRPIAEVYAFWRDLRNLPRFMSHLHEVTPLNGNMSHWIAEGPGGLIIEWDAEIINEVENKVIGWKSIPGSDVISAGSVNFRERPGRGTELRVKLQYEPRAGRAAAWIARLFGDNPEQMIREDLRHLKMVLEAGEVPAIEGQPHGGARADSPQQRTA